MRRKLGLEQFVRSKKEGKYTTAHLSTEYLYWVRDKKLPCYTDMQLFRNLVDVINKLKTNEKLEYNLPPPCDVKWANPRNAPRKWAPRHRKKRVGNDAPEGALELAGQNDIAPEAQ